MASRFLDFLVGDNKIERRAPVVTESGRHRRVNRDTTSAPAPTATTANPVPAPVAPAPTPETPAAPNPAPAPAEAPKAPEPKPAPSKPVAPTHGPKPEDVPVRPEGNKSIPKEGRSMSYDIDDARRRNNGINPELAPSGGPFRRSVPDYPGYSEDPQVVHLEAILDNGEIANLTLGEIVDPSNRIMKNLRTQLGIVALRPVDRFWTFNGADTAKWFDDATVVKMAKNYGFAVNTPKEAAEVLNLTADLFVVDDKRNLVTDAEDHPLRANRAEKNAFREKMKANNA